MIDVNWQPTSRDLRIFSVLCVIFFGFLGYLSLSSGASLGAAVLWGVGGFFGLLGLIRPDAMRLIYVAWMGVAYPIGLVLSYVVMGAIFYLVLTPTGLVMRILGRDSMDRRRDRAADSYWAPRRQPDSLSRYFKGY